MRLFIGIPLAAAVADKLIATSKRLRAGNAGLRWTTPDSWHITLQFLGNTTQEQYACIVARLRQLPFRAVQIQMEPLGCFDRAGVFYAGIALTSELLALQQQVTLATSHCGFTPEERAYHPHITLARAKGRDGKRDLRKLAAEIHGHSNFGSFVAEKFHLYESILSPAGSQYRVCESFPP